MISSSRTSPNATLVSRSTLEQTSAALQKLPEKSKESLSLKEAVDALRGPLTEALGRGYSYEDITAMLGEQGIVISPASLKHYLSRSKRQHKQAAGAKTRQRRSTSADPVTESRPGLDVGTESTPRRGRRKASAPVANAPETQAATATKPEAKRRGRPPANAAAPSVAKRTARSTKTANKSGSTVRRRLSKVSAEP